MRINIIILAVSLLIFSCNKAVKNTDIKQVEKKQEAREKIIQASEINSKIKNQENILYKDVTIIGDITFLSSDDKNLVTPFMETHYINSSILFHNCTFKGKIIAKKTTADIINICNFKKNTTFINCTFQDTVDFSYSDFYGLVNFSESSFQELVNFEASSFNYKKNYFRKVRFEKPLRFNMINIVGDIDFFEAIFDAKSLFQLTKFKDITNFSSTKFNENSDFSNVKFKDDVFFNYAEFYKTISFNNSIFNERTEFINSKFNFISEFKNCLFKGRTKFENSEIIGVFYFTNSIFYISNPNKFKINIKNGSNFVLNDVNYLIK